MFIPVGTRDIGCMFMLVHLAITTSIYRSEPIYKGMPKVHRVQGVSP